MKGLVCSCGAQFKTENERELVEIAKLHGRMSHKKEFNDTDARKMIKDV
ncbi:MAG: DUF1059 domain-containing protein [Candidatus Micrarchaeota archaeon]|nr:DUF1059 domain-containing protein [Candidatus Micrarchaeota archaeon]